MKKVLPIMLSLLLVFLSLTSCAKSNKKADNSDNTSAEISETSSVASVSETTTEPTTEYKEIYYPTPEEYMAKLKEILPGADMDLSYDSTSSGTEFANISWSIQYNKLVKMEFNVDLYINDEGKIIWCSSNVFHEKFTNIFSQLLNDSAKNDVILCALLPSYILACMHNNTEYNESNALSFAGTAIKGLSNSKEYSSTIFGCTFSASFSEMGITNSLDFGKAHSNSKS